MDLLIPITLHKVVQSRAYSVVMLGTKEKKFAIYTDPSVGKQLQAGMLEEKSVRPSTHDLFDALLKGIDAKVIQVVINDVEDTLYFSRIFLEQTQDQKKMIIEMDARPSDAIILALMNDIPLFCTEKVLEKTIAISD